ncbi:hypothetical protein F2Q65_14830 [Thiohalocapsa marina]|uniref:Uncharacterized protein n=1 Tax=Thiohalocapsa marina TaxID=424902 RepID=A0A5M8FRA1_9GAMM|nr:hypothetical protein [Thiohalocapsa marina]KAA6183712.1 hypothetical protein F2Q65_14830 [Thiohalocapsa marina]
MSMPFIPSARSARVTRSLAEGVRLVRRLRRRLKVLIWRVADRLHRPVAAPLPPDTYGAYETPAFLRRSRRERA